MTERRITSQAQRRDEALARATAMGVDEAYISLLVDSFYGHVRAHQLLGPIFEQAIGEDWQPHLARMKRFWESVVLNAGTYSGRPVPAHKKLAGVEPWYFNVWLGLFQRTLEETAPTLEAVEYFMGRAQQIAGSLKYAMFEAPPSPSEASQPPTA